MRHSRLYFFALMPFVLGCIKDDNLSGTGKLAFDEYGRPYYINNTVSEKAFFKATGGNTFAVTDEQITLVDIEGESTVDASQLCYVPEFILDSRVTALTEFYKANEDTDTPQASHKDIMYSLLSDGTLVNASNKEFIMRIISIDDKSFDAFIQVRSRDSNTSLWAQVTYSTIKSNRIDQNLFHNESFNRKVCFDNSGFPYFQNESIPLTEFEHIVNQNGWRITNNCYNFVNNNTGEIKHIDNIIPGYGFTVLFEDDNYYVSKGDNPRKYRYALTNDGTLKNDQDEAELRIVYYGSQKFKAFVLADKTIDGDNRYMLVDFHKMSQADLKEFKEKYEIN